LNGYFLAFLVKVFRQFTQILIRLPRWVVYCRFRWCLRLVAMLEWLRECPEAGPRPQMSQIFAIA
jgi:hypothetical protein